MKRPLALLIAVFVLAGCRGQGAPGTDPFFGRTRVPPPGTGVISGAPTDPYYGGAPYSEAPRYVPPGASTPQGPPATSTQPPASGGGRNYTPPGGTFKYQGSSWTRRGSRLASRSETRITPPALSDRSGGLTPKAASAPPGRERVIQVLQPRETTAGGPKQEIRVPHAARASTTEEPRRLRIPKGAVEITDLPRAGRLTSATRPPAASAGNGVRPVSGTKRPDDSAAVTAAVGFSAATPGRTSAAEFTARENYGHDPDYRWLRGKLEYSQIDRRWKLRYIPIDGTAIDGTTDDFGGSVVLPDEKRLAGCERGDFVEVRGQLGKKAPNSDFSPTYEVAEVKRLGPAAR
jgi:hypothetical protein